MSEFDTIVNLADNIITIVILVLAWQAERKRYDSLIAFVLEMFRKAEDRPHS